VCENVCDEKKKCDTNSIVIYILAQFRVVLNDFPYLSFLVKHCKLRNIICFVFYETHGRSWEF
jgi:hypothetical protein